MVFLFQNEIEIHPSLVVLNTPRLLGKFSKLSKLSYCLIEHPPRSSFILFVSTELWLGND